MTKEWCCGKGKLLFRRLPPYRAEFYDEGVSIDKEFKENARFINTLLSLAAGHVSGKWVKPASGISFVKILGRTYHLLHDLSWRSATGPQESQVVILDGEMRRDISAGHNISPDLMERVHTHLFRVNPLYSEYTRLSTLPHVDGVLQFERTTRATHGPILGDSPEYATEIAAIIRSPDDPEVASRRYARVWKQGEAVARQIHVNDIAYEALCYPVLRDHASEGWFVGMTSIAGYPVTRLEYLRQGILCEQRYTDLTRLAQEYIVDMYSCVEENRLNFHRDNQKRLRMASRRELAIQLGEETELEAGRIYLPSSFANSPGISRSSSRTRWRWSRGIVMSRI